MPRALTGRDLSVLAVANGGAVDGTATYGTAVNVKCYCESYERDSDSGEINVTARCDDDEQNVPTSESVQVTLVLTSPAAGFLIPDSWKRQYIQIIATMVASGDTFTDNLKVKSIRISSPKDGIVTQTVVCNPAYFDS